MKKITLIFLGLFAFGIAIFASQHYAKKIGYAAGLDEGFRNGHSEGKSRGFEEGRNSTVESVDHIKKIFETSEEGIDAKNLTTSIIDMNTIEPQDLKKEKFDSIVTGLHYDIMEQTKKSLALDDELAAQMTERYEAQKTELLSLHFKDYEIIEEQLSTGVNTIYGSYHSYRAISAFNHLVSRNMCNLMMVLIPPQSIPGNTPITKGLVKLVGSQLCESVALVALESFRDHLSHLAIVQDISTILTNNHSRENIIELSTVQDKFNLNITKTFSQEYLWGFFTDEASLDAKVYGTVKVGFDLSDDFQVNLDHTNAAIKILLPQPQILSTEMDVRFTGLSHGWVQKIGNEEANILSNDTKQEIEQKAINSGILQSAKENVTSTLLYFISPLQLVSNSKYDVYIQFTDEEEKFIPKVL